MQMFNGWYFLGLFGSIFTVVALYFLLRKKSAKTQKWVLFSILILGLILHFLKFLIPPYSTDVARCNRDAWFVNICGANIALFPFFYLSKSKTAKDYMFYLGMLGGLIAVFYPMEVFQKSNQAGEILDIVRFYIHHTMLWGVPLLMVLFKHHTLSYKRVWAVPLWLMFVFGFIMVNQILQSELGFIPLRGTDFYNINYKNSSLIWGPGSESLAGPFKALCPKLFRTVPVGEFAGTEKYWPALWLLVPAYICLMPLCFLICLIFDFKNLKADVKSLCLKLKKSK